MCRWLLHMRDLADGDDLMLTQDFLAQMLGVRRPSVSLVAATLQKAGLIKYSRGRIRLLNIPRLKKAHASATARQCPLPATPFGLAINSQKTQYVWNLT